MPPKFLSISEDVKNNSISITRNTKEVTRAIQPVYDNYIYLYHINKLLILPNYPASINDSVAAQFNSSTALGRTAPIQSYQGSGPRTLTIGLELHREMLNQVNIQAGTAEYLQANEDYMDFFIKVMQASVLPRYVASQKLVDPPMAAVRFGNDVFCKGVIGRFGVTYGLPILRNDKFAKIDISFDITEITPYDADMAMRVGSYRDTGDIKLGTSMDSNVYEALDSSNNRNQGLIQNITRTGG